MNTDEFFMKTLPDVLTKKQKMAKIGVLQGRGARWTVTENAQTKTVQEEND